MINRLMIDLVRTARFEIKNGSLLSNSKFNRKNNKTINLDYADSLCQRLFSFRQDEKLLSRIRFKIQDVIDSYNKDWRYVISEAKNRIQDAEGFKKIYVPKDQILTEEQIYGSNHKSNGDKKDGKPQAYFYRQKDQNSAGKKKENQTEAKEIGKPSANKMANLLSCLKADEADKFGVGHTSDGEEDDDVSNAVERRQSMNQFNQTGLNFQKYQDHKPSAGVRREILNMFNEYKELEDKKHAMEEFESICSQYEIQKFQFIGYFLSNSLAEKPQDFRQYIGLVFDCFYIEFKLLDTEQLRER